MRLTLVGSGYVGLVSGACMASLGHTVVCHDRDSAKIAMLRAGRMPIFEPGLEELTREQAREKRLVFTDDLEQAMAGCEVCFIAVGTPPMNDGAADRSLVMTAARAALDAATRDVVIVIKSTVPVGTCDFLRDHLKAHLAKQDRRLRFDVASNPEFLREGCAIADFMHPDRIVVGVQDEWAREALRSVYMSFRSSGRHYLELDTRTSEMSKYVANAMLAVRISFMNEVAQICERVGADVLDVRRAIGLDVRIGPSFLFPGLGYGGSCFPKDVKALARLAIEADCPGRILEAVDRVNAYQRQRMANRIVTRLDRGVRDAKIAVWGLAFKPNTDDIRESPAIDIIHRLAEMGASIRAYDPEARETARVELARWQHVSIASSMNEAVEGADVLLIATEWNLFRQPDYFHLAQVMNQKIIFDGRNLLEPQQARAHGFEYHGIGRAPA